MLSKWIRTEFTFGNIKEPLKTTPTNKKKKSFILSKMQLKVTIPLLLEEYSLVFLICRITIFQKKIELDCLELSNSYTVMALHDLFYTQEEHSKNATPLH